ncbi:MAG TPA: hypothetical protein VK821_05930, partial [Dehalococcoidia bacterium]|nr:hypothetical protein [Dehalococcoidia bacterium]
LEEHAAELAEHFSQSTDRVELTKAVSYGELASQRALAVYAYGEAARHLEQALAVQEVLDPDDTAKRCDLLLMLGEALLPAGDPLRVIEAVAPEALALAENLRDDSRSSRACQAAVEGFWLQYGPRGRATAEFRRWAGDADRLASPGSLERVYADIALSRAAFWEDRELAWDLAERALALAHQLGDAQAIRSCAGQMLGGAWPFHHAGARLRLAEEFALQPAAGAGATAFSIRSGAFNVFLIWGQRERAEQMAREARAIADRTRHISALVQASALEIQLLALSGRLEEAMEAGEALVRRGQELGAPGLARDFARRATFWPSLHLGRAEGTLVAAEQEPVDLAGVLSGGGRGLARAHLGQWDAAREDLDRLREVWRKRGRAVGWSSATQPLWLAAAVLVSDRRLVELLRDSLAPAAGMLSQLFPTRIARHLGAASALLGETDKARGYYQQAIEICEKVRFRPELALTRLELAELMLGEANSNQPSAISTPPRAPERKRGGLTADKLKADASRAEALAHLDFAIAEFREMKMQPSLERALRHKDVLKA